MTETCEKCKFWEGWSSYISESYEVPMGTPEHQAANRKDTSERILPFGICKRYPTTYKKKCNDRCGEWEAKE